MILVCLGLGCLPVYTQSKIQGWVTDQTGQRMPYTRVSINEKTQLVSDAKGYFEIHPEVSFYKPKQVQVQKHGYLLKEWYYGNAEMKIILEPSFTIQGHVKNVENLPIPDMNVLLVGVAGMKPTQTDEQGYFRLEVPSSQNIKEENLLIAFDSERYRSKVNYEMFFRDSNHVDFVVEFVPRRVKKVKILDQDQQPLTGVSIWVDDVKYFSDLQGEFQTPATVSDYSGFRAEAFCISQLEYDRQEAMMRVYLRHPKAGETNQPKELNWLEDRMVKKID